jgi:hypothetical protein
MTDREQLQAEALQLAEIIESDEPALQSPSTPSADKTLLRLAIGQRKDYLAVLKRRLASLRHL